MAADVIYEAVPGGSAPADDAAAIVDAIIALPEVRTSPFRSCLLWVLVLIARWTGVYAAIHETGRGSITEEVLSCERATRSHLAEAAARLQDMASDPDPEVRSMIYRLIGASLQGPAVVPLLREAADRETNELARGCAVEGAVVAMLRQWPGVSPGSASWLRESIDLGGAVTLGRIRHVLAGHALPQSADLAAEVIPASASDLPPEGPFWPVELI